jgi:cytochrome c-type biogenesis protein CcmH
VSRLSRRTFFGQLGAAALLPLQESQGPLAGQGDVGTLRDPAAAGRPRAPTEIADYDERIKTIEQRLACTCGCTLDIFTCRTTDFTCTYSPALHREVVELDRAGNTAPQILDAFVAKYGEKALMAPKPEGFNLWGYLLPGSAILLGGGALVAFISRRRVAVAQVSGSRAAPVPDVAPTVPRETPAAPAATPEEMERLRRALAEVED